MSVSYINKSNNSHVNFVRKLVEHMQQHKAETARKKAIRALNSLGQETLKDLAINRTEITSLVYCDQQERRRNYTH